MTKYFQMEFWSTLGIFSIPFWCSYLLSWTFLLRESASSVLSFEVSLSSFVSLIMCIMDCINGEQLYCTTLINFLELCKLAFQDFTTAFFCTTLSQGRSGRGIFSSFFQAIRLVNSLLLLHTLSPCQSYHWRIF